MLKKISAIVVPTLIAVAILALMLYSVWGDLLLTLSHIYPPFLVAATIICIVSWVLRGARYRYILQALGVGCSLLFSTACIFISQTANLIVPARLGDIVRLFILKHEKDVTYSKGFSSVVIERLFDIISVALLGVISLPFAVDVPDWFYTVIAIPLGGGLVFFILLVWLGRISSDNRYIRIILGMLDEVREASLNLPALAALSISSLVIWITDVLVCLMVVMMFRVDIPFSTIVLAIVIGNLVKAVPLTPGGVGTYEVSLALIFEASGVAPATAVLIAVIDHLIKNLVTLAGGIASVYYFGGWTVSLVKKALDWKLGGRDDARD